jgi:hypothetical protein
MRCGGERICGVLRDRALGVLGGRWTLLIVWELPLGASSSPASVAACPGAPGDARDRDTVSGSARSGTGRDGDADSRVTQARPRVIGRPMGGTTDDRLGTAGADGRDREADKPGITSDSGMRHLNGRTVTCCQRLISLPPLWKMKIVANNAVAIPGRAIGSVIAPRPEATSIEPASTHRRSHVADRVTRTTASGPAGRRR